MTNAQEIKNLKLSLAVHSMQDLAERLMIVGEEVNFDNIWKAYHQARWGYKFSK